MSRTSTRAKILLRFLLKYVLFIDFRFLYVIVRQHTKCLLFISNILNYITARTLLVAGDGAVRRRRKSPVAGRKGKPCKYRVMFALVYGVILYSMKCSRIINTYINSQLKIQVVNEIYLHFKLRFTC